MCSYHDGLCCQKPQSNGTSQPLLKPLKLWAKINLSPLSIDRVFLSGQNAAVSIPTIHPSKPDFGVSCHTGRECVVLNDGFPAARPVSHLPKYLNMAISCRKRKLAEVVNLKISQYRIWSIWIQNSTTGVPEETEQVSTERRKDEGRPVFPKLPHAATL